MQFNAYPALSIRQPDVGRTLATIAAMKSANFRNQLLRRKMDSEDRVRGLTGNAVNELFRSGGGGGAAPSLAQGAPPPSAGGPTNALLAGTGAAPESGGAGAQTAPLPGAAGADVFQGRKAPPALIALARVDPGRALNVMKLYDNAEDRERAEMKRVNQKAGALLTQFDDLPDEQKPLLWPQFLRHAKEKLGLNISRIPQQYSPRMFDQLYAETAGTAQYIKMVERREAESTFTVQGAKGPYRFKPTRGIKNALALGLEPGTKEFKDYIRKFTLSGSGGTTPAQQANNTEVRTARRRITALKKDLQPGETLRDLILRRTQKATDTGRDNPDYSPLLARDLQAGMQRMVGKDPEYERFLALLDQRKAPAAAPPAAAAKDEGPGVLSGIADTIQGWLTPDAGEAGAAAAPADIGVGPGAPSPAPASASPAAGAPMQVPMAADGKKVDAAKLVPGQAYMTKRGIAVWDGRQFTTAR